ncbi:MAG: Rpn family recombination-promoting nuclease/putative transposase [Agathobacter sp.]|nr:Rpn family recombination-promoting nuclease/putative transposase [Agathobacter sp.]
MGKRRKTLQELTFKDNFMFAAVMLDEENAKGVVERALGIQIDHVEISYEKSIVYNPEYKGIRLDVYLKDDKNRHFNVEMQVANTEIFKRSRYYHSQIDMELLSTGIDYEQLPESYVIFICDFDPIGLGKYKYTRRQVIEEDLTYNYDDGSYTVFLSTVGTNEGEVSQDLVKFLKYVGAELEESNEDYSDEFVKRLQKSVEKIKFDKEIGRRYMLFEELMKEEYNAGRVDSARSIIIELLSETAPVSVNLKDRISSIKEYEDIMQLTVKAAKADSLVTFEKELEKMGY